MTVSAKRPHALSSIVVIPARLASTRLPGKLLLRETGKPLLQHTYESACQARRPREVWVAAADPEIAREVLRFGGRACMTDPAACCGTDRVAEIAAQRDDVDVLVNMQGDEPELPGAAIDRTVELLEERPQAAMSTLAAPIRTRHQLEDPSCVKVVCDGAGRALYFSRCPIPFVRHGDVDALLHSDPPVFLLHIGLYAYRRAFLLEMARLPPARLEQMEGLEQLRVLSYGFAIHVGLVDVATAGIDTPADYRAFVERMRLRKSA